MHVVAEPQSWPGSRWGTLIAVVFATQLALILWLGKSRPVFQRPNDPAPRLQLAGSGSAEMLALRDPTLFALPHLEGFSGLAWLTIAPVEVQALVSSEPPVPLSLTQERLGADFKAFMATNQPNDLPVFRRPELDLRLPVVAEPDPFPTQSRLRLLGGLAGRHLLVFPALPPWPGPEILTKSVVQVLVTADGKPHSAVLLKPGVPNEADQFAVREARRVRFEPVDLSESTNPVAGLTWGQLVFEWYTLPATNNAVEAAPGK